MNKYLIPLLVLLLLLVACDPDNTKYIPYSKEQLIEFEEICGLDKADYDVAFFGDSRVSGCDWQSALEDTGLKIINLGIGGDIVEGLIARIDEIDRSKAEKCFVSIGGNNCSKANFSLKRFRKAYDSLLTLLEMRRIEVIVCTNPGVIYPRNDKFSKNINDCDAIIKELAAIHGMKVMDVSPLMNDSAGHLKQEYTVEGVHYNQTGYDVWLSLIRPYLETT